MFGKFVATVAVAVALTGSVNAETFEVKMLNASTADEKVKMVFEPAFLRVAAGDTVKFLPTSKGHNAEAVKEMVPEGAEPFKGKINKEIEVVFDVEGLYGVKCKPHYAMGMVMTVMVGESTDIPENFFEGRVPKKARARFEEQLSGL